MKSIAIVLAASFLAVVAAPSALAADDCASEAQTDYIVSPFDDEKRTYLFINPTVPNKLGEWSEANENPGLQTEACFQSGVLIAFADTKAGSLLP